MSSIAEERVIWFQSPINKWFQLAYKIERKLFKNCVPVSCGTGNGNEKHEVGVEFTANPVKDLMVDSMSGFLKENLKDKSWNFAIRDLIDVAFSHNEIINLCCKDTDPRRYISIYTGEVWAIPDEYLSLKIDKFFGAIPESIHEADAINILVEDDITTITPGLPKKKHDTIECTEEGDRTNAEIFE